MQKTMINDLTQGSVLKQLIRFSLPLILANALQICYNVVDMLFVGQFAGTDAQSAVSIGGQITMLMFSVFIGIAAAAQIYISQAVGAGKRDELNGIIGTAITMSLVVGGVLMLMIPLARPILTLMRTPESIMDQTVDYLVICCYINVLVALYNGLCGILQGMGDSSKPMIFVGIATVVNVVLDYLFVAVFHWGAAGAAWATIIGQSVACLCAVVYLYRHREAFGFDFKPASFIPQRRHLVQMVSIGIPVTAKNICINLSFLVVNAQINSMGVVAVAATGICQKLESLTQIVSRSVVDATASMSGQNMGAGKLDRIKKTVRCAFVICAVFGGVLIALFEVFPTQIFDLFSNDPEVIGCAVPYMVVAGITVLSYATMPAFIGFINGIGNTVLNMKIAIVDAVVARIVLSLLFGYVLDMGALGFLLGNALAGFVSVFWGGGYFLSGKWRKLIPAPREDELG